MEKVSEVKDVAFLEPDLVAKGLKVTLPRMKVLSVLSSTANANHVSAEDVYNQLLSMGEEVSLATVYRVLTQFEAAGLVKRHCFDGDRAVYELNNGDTHNHSVCIRCSQVSEFTSEIISKELKTIAKDRSFMLSDYNVVIYGICEQCRGKRSR